MNGWRAPAGSGTGGPQDGHCDSLGRGLGNLLHGTRQPNQRLDEGGAARAELPAWYFYGADLLLLACACGLALSRAPLGLLESILCGLFIWTGAVLALVPVLRLSGRRTPRVERNSKWVLLQEKSDLPRFVAHLQTPFFLAQIQNGQGRPRADLLWTAGPADRVPSNLIQEAVAFYRSHNSPALKPYQRPRRDHRSPFMG